VGAILADLSIRRHIQKLLDQIISGIPLSQIDAYALTEINSDELEALCAAARSLREQHKNHIITYSRNVFIPLTTLCRNTCGYCGFVKAPGDPAARTLKPDEVLEIAEAGRQAGCREALFSLGERPEQCHALAQEHLRELGYSTMLDYLRAMCELVYTQTGILPHANPGTLLKGELAALRETTISMGMMLETTSTRLSTRGQPHFGCPDKVPQRRIATLRSAGELQIPFTTGILVGIGETRAERIAALLTIRDIHKEYGHIHEVIVQNFRAKPKTRMANSIEPGVDEMRWTLVVARLIFGGTMNLQAPPNLTPNDYGTYLDAGINDWGGVSPVTHDHINPEAAWPKLEELQRVTRQKNCVLRERLALHAEYALEPERWIPEILRPQVVAQIDSSGLVKQEL
jgi:FO synthase